MRDVRRVEVDFLVVIVEVEAGCVCNSVHFAEDKGYRTRAWYACFGETAVEVCEHGGDGVFERVRRVREAQEGAGAIGGEVAEFEAEQGFSRRGYGVGDEWELSCGVGEGGRVGGGGVEGMGWGKCG